jgi:hypothetical protein
MSGTNDTNFFTAGDLVISLSGDGAGTGLYGDNQASPIALEEVTTFGTEVASMELPQTTMVVNGITESAISGEYGSSSEGTLQLAANGESLVIMGYGINADTFNSGGAAVYGNAALAQSTSILNNGTYTAVPRVVADISYTGAVDTSTAVYNVFNTNNPRSAATVDGTTFYISGQGVKGDTTQGVFAVQDGSSTATPIDTATDTRTVEIYDNALYVSQDSKQPSKGGTSNISTFNGLPTAATTPTVLPGISQSITLQAGQANGINNADIGSSVNLSPESYVFANATTLYVADGGDPKQGGLGDGGLQKWTFDGTSWTLDYTLSAGLNLVPDTGTAGTTGLIGLTGQVTGDTVELYATNSTLGDLDQTYLFGITDTLSATTLPTDESFTVLDTAPADTNIRGVSFAPTAPCFAAGTMIRTASGEVPVEALAVGDALVTITGAAMPIRWIGLRAVDCLHHPEPTAVLPVRVAAHAFGPGLPERPLFLSPDHAIFAEGVLIPVKHLINGTGIAQVAVERLTYYHIELAEHAIILAEGLPAESYLDTGDRCDFANGGAAMTLHPVWGTEARDVTLIHDALGAAPLRVAGAEVDRVRAMLAPRAGGGERAAACARRPDGSARGTRPRATVRGRRGLRRGHLGQDARPLCHHGPHAIQLRTGHAERRRAAGIP